MKNMKYQTKYELLDYILRECLACKASVEMGR